MFLLYHAYVYLEFLILACTIYILHHPGAGKFFFLYNWMQFKDAPIIGNFATNFSSIKKRKGFYIFMDNSELTPDKLIKFSQYYSQIKGRRVKEGEILLVIDECQILFNSRDWGQKNRAQWCSFFTQHRKLGYEVVRWLNSIGC